MGLDRNILERQLDHANQALDARVKTLDGNGVGEKERRLDPKWRNLNAQCRQLKRRIRSAQAVVDLDEELKRRKAEGGEEAGEE